ncbi:conserved hypothetical protein [Acinetobacter proteolyticus]|jgi:hypothetical protein|uniref:Uncharacterized protein n=1 Tax=Acinetobacter proteolyticus TaxID=1776741 RepID=A0A653K931_9GAMM|nr:hypothetical protein [Acinetobacter proteolyticus]VXA57380.1 conserved hypothetical protein [Acinetobacter proteolyticus]
MSNIQYVIRQNDFAYNDEWHLTNCVSTGAIKQIYTDKVEAEKAYKSLVVEGLYYDELCNYDIGNGEVDDEIYEKLEALVLEKTGKKFDIEDGKIPKLNEDDAFEFAQISGIVWYQLLEVDATQPCYVLWINSEEDYFSGYETGSIISSQDENFSDVSWESNIYAMDYEFEALMNKPLSELSDSPLLLKQFIEQTADIRYDAEKDSIEGIALDNIKFIDIKALNSFLKQPIFEIRQISLEQLAELE